MRTPGHSFRLQLTAKAVAAAVVLAHAGHLDGAPAEDHTVETVAPVEAAIVPVAERPDGRPIYTHRLNASGRLIQVTGTMPPAEGVLAFLADDAALRAGTVALTKEQADAALAALVRATGQDVESTLNVSVAVGNPAKMVTGKEVRYPIGWKKDPATADAWLASSVETRTLGVGLAVSSQRVTDGRIQLEVTVETTKFDGFVELEAPTEKTTVLSEFFALSDLKPGTPPPAVNMGPHVRPFFEPVYLTHAMTARFRMKPGETIVLRGDGARVADQGSRTGALLVFFTATVEPLVR